MFSLAKFSKTKLNPGSGYMIVKDTQPCYHIVLYICTVHCTVYAFIGILCYLFMKNLFANIWHIYCDFFLQICACLRIQRGPA